MHMCAYDRVSLTVYAIATLLSPNLHPVDGIRNMRHPPDHRPCQSLLMGGSSGVELRACVNTGANMEI